MKKQIEVARAWIRQLDVETKLAATAVSICVFLFTTFATISHVEGRFDQAEKAEAAAHQALARAHNDLKRDIRDELREIKESVKTTENRVFIMFTKERKRVR